MSGWGNKENKVTVLSSRINGHCERGLETKTGRQAARQTDALADSRQMDRVTQLIQNRP